MKIYPSLLITACLFIGCFSSSKYHRGSYQPLNDEVTEIPYETISGLIIIPASINGVSGKFLFDNGFSLNAVNEDFAKRAGITFKKKTSVNDANNKRSQTLETTVDMVQINNQRFLKTGFIQINTHLFFPCDSIDGVIGAATINFKEKKIQIASNPFEGEGGRLTFNIVKNNSSFTKIKVKDVQFNCKIDLGSAKSLELDKQYCENFYIGMQAEKRIGITSISANGLGNVEDEIKLSDLLAVYSPDRLPIPARVIISEDLKYQGYVGMGYVKQYQEAIINSSRNEYLLIPPVDYLPKIDSGYGIAIYPMKGSWKLIQKDAYDPDFEELELMEEVVQIDSMPLEDFKGFCEYKAYLKAKIKKGEAVSLQFKNSGLIEFPVRENKRKVIGE